MEKELAEKLRQKGKLDDNRVFFQELKKFHIEHAVKSCKECGISCEKLIVGEEKLYCCSLSSITKEAAMTSEEMNSAINANCILNNEEAIIYYGFDEM